MHLFQQPGEFYTLNLDGIPAAGAWVPHSSHLLA